MEKQPPEFTWNPNNFPYYFNTSIANIVVSSNTDYANCPLTITSSNENIAKVENGRLYIYDQSGEVTFTVTQRGNDRYNEHIESFTFTPKAKPDLEAPFQVTPEIYNQAITVGNNCSWDGDDHHVKLGNGALDDLEGFFFALFAIGVSAAETAVAIAIIINIYRNIKNIQVKNLDEMKH